MTAWEVWESRGGKVGENRGGKLVMEIVWVGLMAPDMPAKGGDVTAFPTWASSGNVENLPHLPNRRSQE